MAQQIINIGHTANDKGGDPIRTAFNKVNENFTELYAAFGLQGKLEFKKLEYHHFAAFNIFKIIY